MDMYLPRLRLGQTHTHTNDVSCGDYMVAYEDFAHVGVACLIFFLWDNCALVQSAPEDSESRMRARP